MTHPAEAIVTETLAALRDAALDERVTNDTPLIPNLYFSWDSDEGDVSVAVTSQPGTLCTISAKVARPPRWFSMNLELGTATFGPGDVIGLVARTAFDTDVYLPVFVRSGRAGGTDDTALPTSLAGEERGGVAAIIHTLSTDAPMAWGEAYHTLVISLPAQDFTLDLQDLRFFVLPASETAGLRTETLSSFGR